MTSAAGWLFSRHYAFGNMALLALFWAAMGIMLLPPFSDRSVPPAVSTVEYAIAAYLAATCLLHALLWFLAYRSGDARGTQGFTVSLAIVATSVAAIGANAVSIATSNSASWVPSGRTVALNLGALFAVLIVGSFAIVRAWSVLRGAAKGTQAAIAIPIMFAATSMLLASSFFGTAVSASIPLGVGQNDQVVIFSSHELEDLNVQLTLGYNDVLETEGQRLSGMDVASPFGRVALSVSGRGTPGARVQFAAQLFGQVAASGPIIPTNASLDYRDSVSGAGTYSVGWVNDGVCRPVENLAPISSNEREGRLVRWEATVDASGSIAWSTFLLGEPRSWFYPAGSKNIVDVPGVTILNTVAGRCAIGESGLQGAWTAASGASTIDVQVNGFVPREAVIDKRPYTQESAQSLRWVMSNGPVTVGGEPAIRMESGTLDASYLIATGATETRSGRSTFFAGVFAGGAMAGAFEFARAIFGGGSDLPHPGGGSATPPPGGVSALALQRPSTARRFRAASIGGMLARAHVLFRRLLRRGN